MYRSMYSVPQMVSSGTKPRPYHSILSTVAGEVSKSKHVSDPHVSFLVNFKIVEAGTLVWTGAVRAAQRTKDGCMG